MPTMNDLRAQRDNLEHLIEVRQRELGADHPDLANDLRDLGRLSHELGEMMDAQAQLRRALALHTEALGAEHPETATDINHLGLVLHDIGDLEGAQAAFERALAIDETALGRDHPSVARDTNNLAGVLKDHRRRVFRPRGAGLVSVHLHEDAWSRSPDDQVRGPQPRRPRVIASPPVPALIRRAASSHRLAPASDWLMT